MEFSFSQDRKGNKYLGLILKKSRGKVFNLYECLIAPRQFSDILSRVRHWWLESGLDAFHFHKGTGHLRTLTIREGRRTGMIMVMLTVSGNPGFSFTDKQLQSFIQAINDPDISLFLRVQQTIKGQPTQFFEMHLGGPDHIVEELYLVNKKLRFKISPSSFFQPNTLQAEKLYSSALAMAEVSSNDIVFDLYAGTATLGMTFAHKAQFVTAVELNPYAVFDAKANAEINQISNIEIVKDEVGAFLSSTPLKPTLVIVDPPRAGLDEKALAYLEQLQAQKIIYISCNPKTQGANLAFLPSYQIRNIQPVDQFPHTDHIENIILLDRNPPAPAS